MEYNNLLPIQKEKKVKNKLKIKPLLFIIPVFLLVIITFTIAFFYTRNSFENSFKTSAYNIKLEEEFYDDWGTKVVSLVNEDGIDVVIRINYNEIWSKTIDGTLYTLNNKYNGEDVVTKEWTEAFKNDFIKGSDGWYYYKKVLKSNDTVTILRSININEDLIQGTPYYDDYKSYDYELTFTYEAIQADTKAVKEIWDKNISITGENVTWPS